MQSLLQGCGERIGYTFIDKRLLQSALTHASGQNTAWRSNERLEFLGDAILGAVVCELLFRQYPQYLEGDLTRIKSIVVSRQTCAKISESLGNAGIPDPGQGDDDSSVGSAFAAGRRLRIDRGCHVSRRRHGSIPHFLSDATCRPRSSWRPSGEMGNNYKSMLQQLAQREHGTTPTYQLLDEKGSGPQQVLQDCGPGGQQSL